MTLSSYTHPIDTRDTVHATPWEPRVRQRSHAALGAGIRVHRVCVLERCPLHRPPAQHKLVNVASQHADTHTLSLAAGPHGRGRGASLPRRAQLRVQSELLLLVVNL